MTPVVDKEICYPDSPSKKGSLSSYEECGLPGRPFCTHLRVCLTCRATSPKVMISLEQHTFACWVRKRFKDLTISSHHRVLWRTIFDSGLPTWLAEILLACITVWVLPKLSFFAFLSQILISNKHFVLQTPPYLYFGEANLQ